MRHIHAILIAMVGVLLVLVPAVRADSLQLKNGNFLQGKYLGGTDRAVQFEVNGKVRLYDIGEILSISFAAASADGGIPSNNVDTKLSADTVSNSSAKDNAGLRTTLWNQKKAPERFVQRMAWEQKQSKGLGNPRMAWPASCRAANSEAKARVSIIPGRSASILPKRFAVLSD